MSASGSDAVYVDEPWLLMRWDSDHQCVFAEWKAFATSAEFQGALTRVLEVIRERAAVNFVTDTRNLESVSNEDQRWIRYNWAPLAIAAGMKRIAVIEGKHGLAKFAIDVMFKGQRNTGSRLQSRTFDSVAEAMKWVAGSA